MKILQQVANREISSIIVSLDDVMDGSRDAEFVTAIIRNTKRYINLFSLAADQLMPEPTRDIVMPLSSSLVACLSCCRMTAHTTVSRLCSALR